MAVENDDNSRGFWDLGKIQIMSAKLVKTGRVYDG